MFVTVKGEDETEDDFVEWAAPVVIDLVSGTARAVGEPAAASPGHEPVALGDGTWIAVDPEPDEGGAPLVRRRFQLTPG